MSVVIAKTREYSVQKRPKEILPYSKQGKVEGMKQIEYVSLFINIVRILIHFLFKIDFHVYSILTIHEKMIRAINHSCDKIWNI